MELDKIELDLDKELTEDEVLHREVLLIAWLSGYVVEIVDGRYWCREHGTLYIDRTGCPCTVRKPDGWYEFLEADEIKERMLQVILTGQKDGGVE